MTGPDDDVTAALTRAFRHHAEEVPAEDGLPEKVVALAARRRRRRINASIAAIVVLVVGVPVAVVATTDRDGGGPPSVAAEIDPSWRWESYRGVQAPVPPDWGYGVAHSAWCAAGPEGEPSAPRPGAVGRPGPMYAVLCPSEYPPPDERENWLAFDHANREGVRRADHGWVEETRRVNGVYLTVFSDDAALRSAILRSARAIPGTDKQGCPTGHPVVTNPGGYRPDAEGGGLPSAGAVESISVCRYSLDQDIQPPLLSSRRVTGTAAKDAVTAILAAPDGEGPDTEGDSDSHGAEIVVLRVGTADGTREVVVRYSGSQRNGFDDGTTRRQLTAGAVRPLLTGATSPATFKYAVVHLFDE